MVTILFCKNVVNVRGGGLRLIRMHKFVKKIIRALIFNSTTKSVSELQLLC